MHEFKPNLNNLKITKKAVYTWQNAALAHEGYTDVNNQRQEGYPFIDRTLSRISPAQLVSAELDKATSLNQAFTEAANSLGKEFKATLDQAPSGTPFDYQEIKQSQDLTFE